jgi:hypothetical protein
MATFKPSAVFPNDAYAFSDSEEEDGAEATTNPGAEAVLAKCTKLLEEIESFQTSLRRNKLENSVEIRGFLTQVKAEHRIIQGVSRPEPLGVPAGASANTRWIAQTVMP